MKTPDDRIAELNASADAMVDRGRLILEVGVTDRAAGRHLLAWMYAQDHAGMPEGLTLNVISPP